MSMYGMTFVMFTNMEVLSLLTSHFTHGQYVAGVAPRVGVKALAGDEELRVQAPPHTDTHLSVNHLSPLKLEAK